MIQYEAERTEYVGGCHVVKYYAEVVLTIMLEESYHNRCPHTAYYQCASIGCDVPAEAAAPGISARF